MDRIYMDNAATTAVSPEVLQTMLPYFSEIYGNPSSIYSTGRERPPGRGRSPQAGGTGHRRAAHGDLLHRRGQRERQLGHQGHSLRQAGQGQHTSSPPPLSITRCCTPASALEKQGFQVTYLPVDEYGRVRVRRTWKRPLRTRPS